LTGKPALVIKKNQARLNRCSSMDRAVAAEADTPFSVLDASILKTQLSILGDLGPRVVRAHRSTRTLLDREIRPGDGRPIFTDSASGAIL
jgi:hypothetical protein